MSAAANPRPADSASPGAGVGSSGGALAACLIGAPLGAAAVMYLLSPALAGTIYQRYVSHPIEWAEVVLFAVAVAALALKALGAWRHRRAGRGPILPPWDGTAVPVSEAPGLLAGMTKLPNRLKHCWAGRRAAAVLDFLCRRRSAAELDDQARCLADADALALEGSYSFLRFVIWSIPILGFLGTVLGIADAVSGVTPEVLEESISTVTEGLALAFDTTGLALMLTMVVMFLTYLVERKEQAALGEVDEFVDRHLAHRFHRPAVESAPFVAAVEANSAVLVETMDRLVRGQAEVWARSLAETEARRAEAEQHQQERLRAALESALATTLDLHDARLAQTRRDMEERAEAVLAPLTALAATLAPMAESMRAMSETLARLHDDEGRLLRLQQGLQENLQALTASGAFEQALHSLTAAVHLLTARAAPAAPWRVVNDAA
jgi:hypothetical protein